MSTKAKIVTGYINTDVWVNENIYYQHWDGYPDNMIPALKQHINELDEVFEELNYFNDISGVDYIYYLDLSDLSNITCTVLEYEWGFYNHYGVDSYNVIAELTL